MACPDHTAPTCPLDHRGRIFDVTSPPAEALPWQQPRRGVRRPEPPPEDPYALAVQAIESVLIANRDYRMPPGSSGHPLAGPLPLDAAQCYGLCTAMHLLSTYAGRHQALSD